MHDIHQTLKQYFGYDHFRPLQENIINAVLSGKDTLALLPTGGGKSVCYQVPALVQQGICLVITPLIALMKDQVTQLRKRNISALSIHSGMSFYEVKKAIQNATTGNFKFLYVSPERLKTNLFKEYLPAMPVNLIAVDEAHCISQWGYDFRPPYLEIAAIREELPGVPILALTASATKDVQDDICDKLAFGKHEIFRQSFAKPNLSFSAFNTPHKINKLFDILHNVPGTALVYVRNRRRTKEIAKLLQLQGINATYYNAGLAAEERNKRQEEWIQDKVRVMTCTNAFGMGIDKAAVRTVVHMDVPDCIESYYQEAGRAGRDGKKAYAVLLLTDDDLKELQLLPAKKFPSVDEIQYVYQSICNYLQIPVGAGEGEYYDFNLQECCERFKMDAVLAVNVLQTLAQAGYLSFSENVFIPGKAGFTVSKETLYVFEKDHPDLEPLIKTLLRSYEGIFDNIVSISEKTIARLMQTDAGDIMQRLQLLNQHAIIEYRPRKESPQLFFLYNRISVSQITIDIKAYESRKKQYTLKINEMITYARQTLTCRSSVIRKYFGDVEITPCGVCDICLAKKPTAITYNELARLAAAALLHIGSSTSVQELQHTLRLSMPQTEAVIQFLIKEEKIVWNKDGKFQLKQTA